ncbi:antiviral reverse transcriptase Drt3b [Methylobacterium sp.]|uniref:antiviral reverse transcriptase Drt3b n=1 Tax=Methylobacterium sp. TaxID=409 RepID=UPI003D142984
MAKRITIKGNIKKDDFYRAVITDTSPFEVPLIFSNDGLYKNCSKRDEVKSHLAHLIAAVFKNESFTVPYRYNIVKNSKSSRQLSLLHPSVQIETCDFYRDYEDLICYYCTQSAFTIRAPRKTGSIFYFSSPIADKNKYKNSYIDTVEIDKLVKNPASYFAYRGYDRLHKFFNSPDFLRLEKKFCFMISLDVSKCFDSIYTHSIAWALKDINTAKENIWATHFGSRFDSLMQRMNYNETNGICIGAEISRIFAEIILGRVDRSVETRLFEKGLRLNADYEVKRYVDNFYIFCNDEQVASLVQSFIVGELRDFKLHINESKLEKWARPFYSKKSKVTDDASRFIEGFFSQILDSDVRDDVKFTYPKKINRYNALLRSVINDIKSACFSSEVGYEQIANYIISAFSIRLLRLADDLEHSLKYDLFTEEDYISVVTMLLELSFFFYSMSPTVASSLAISKSIIIAGRSVSKSFPTRLPFVQERIVRWTAQLMRDPRLIAISRNCDAIPIEILNILIAMHDIAADHTFSEQTFRQIFPNVSELKYFSIISCLFIIRDNPRLYSFRKELLDHIRASLLSSNGIGVSSHDAHLLLDSLSCPFLPQADRVALYKDVVKRFHLKGVTNAEAAEAVQECERSPWFVSWSGVELLSLITKKELSAVY